MANHPSLIMQPTSRILEWPQKTSFPRIDDVLASATPRGKQVKWVSQRISLKGAMELPELMD